MSSTSSCAASRTAPTCRPPVLGRHPRHGAAHRGGRGGRVRRVARAGQAAAGAGCAASGAGPRVARPGPRQAGVRRQLGAVPGRGRVPRARPRTDHRRPAHRRGHRHDAPLGRGRRLVHRRRRPCVRPIHRLGGPLAPAPLGGHRWRPAARCPRPGHRVGGDLPARPARVGRRGRCGPAHGPFAGLQVRDRGAGGARRAPGDAPHRSGTRPRDHRPQHPLPPRSRRDRPRDGLVPGRHLGGATERARAVHARGRIGVGRARGPAPRAATRTTRSGPRRTLACPAAARGPSSRPWTSCCAAAATS